MIYFIQFYIGGITMAKKDITLSATFWEDDRWAHSNYQDLAKKYPNQWIAVLNKKVVAFSESLAKVEDEAARIAGGKDFPMLFVEKGAHVYKN